MRSRVMLAISERLSMVSMAKASCVRGKLTRRVMLKKVSQTYHSVSASLIYPPCKTHHFYSADRVNVIFGGISCVLRAHDVFECPFETSEVRTCGAWRGGDEV